MFENVKVSTRYSSPTLNSEPVKFGQGDSIADVPLASLDSALLLYPPFFLLLPSAFLLVFLISQGGARTNISSQRPHPEVGIEKGTPSAHSFINIYPHLNPSETESSSLSSCVLFSYSFMASSRSNSQACICSCKSFIRFVRGFASITAMGDLNRLFHLGLFLLPFFPVFSLYSFSVSLISLSVMTRPKFSSVLRLFCIFFFFG